MLPKNFCHAPWVSIEIDQEGGRLRPCCKFRPNMAADWENFNINNHSISDYKNSNGLKKLKESFLRGERPSPCIRCWQDEDANYKSKRILDFENWQDKLLQYDLDKSETLWLTLPLGTICNLKCRICSPISSTSWLKEYKDLYNKDVVKNNWESDPKIWKEILNIAGTSIDIHLHGGEPFLYDNDKHLELLETISSSSSADKVKLHYNTNASIFPDKKYWDYWLKFKWVDIQPSIDDMEHRFEYNRKNAVWLSVAQNLFMYRDLIEKSDNMQFSISTTVSVFTIYYLKEFFDWAVNNGLPKPWLGKLFNPEYYRCSIFPKEYKNIIREKLNNSGHSDLISISSWLDQDDSHLLETFRTTTAMHDKYRKESFSTTFPEINSWLL